MGEGKSGRLPEQARSRLRNDSQKSKGKGNSRFPEEMTERKARAKADAALVDADVFVPDGGVGGDVVVHHGDAFGVG
jgi:hypothetical protein